MVSCDLRLKTYWSPLASQLLLISLLLLILLCGTFMKSIFFVVLFIVVASMLSQPEKSEVKYSPLSVSVPQNFMQNEINNNLSIHLIPQVKSKTYSLVINTKILKLVQLSGVEFPFADCKIKQRPAIVVNCNLKKIKKGFEQVVALSLKPMIIAGNDNPDFYLVEINNIDKDGATTKYKFFTTKDLVSKSSGELPVKVTKN